jgi:hypothetical protein
MENCHPSVENKKTLFLDKLYKADGRGDRAHPMHGLYTGLYRAYEEGKLVIGEFDVSP